MFPTARPIEFHTGDLDYSARDVSAVVCLPLHGHPGTFGFKRKNHIHEGVDLYCQENDPVYCIEPGVVVGAFDFTGARAGSPWWNDTQCVLVQGASGVINYGEIGNILVKPGDLVVEGQQLGAISRVLRHNKGRPMDMLHLELYAPGTVRPISEWALCTPKPSNLWSPVNLLVQEALRCQMNLET